MTDNAESSDGQDRRSTILADIAGHDDRATIRPLGDRLIEEMRSGLKVALPDDDLAAAKILTTVHDALLRGSVDLDVAGIDRLVRDWHHFYETHDEWYRWAEQAVIDLVPPMGSMSLQDGWSLVLKLLDTASASLGIVLAGPFEDIFEGYPNEIAALIEASIGEHPRLRDELGDVSYWSVPDEVRARVKAIVDSGEQPGGPPH